MLKLVTTWHSRCAKTWKRPVVAWLCSHQTKTDPNEKHFATLIRGISVFTTEEILFLLCCFKSHAWLDFEFRLGKCGSFYVKLEKMLEMRFPDPFVFDVGEKPLKSLCDWEMTLSNETKQNHTFLCSFSKHRESKVHKKFNGVCLSGFCLETMSSSSCCVSNL
jgi:hypothetical protein